MCRRQAQFRPQPAAYMQACVLQTCIACNELPLGKTVKLAEHSEVPFRILLSMHVRDRRILWEACDLIVHRMWQNSENALICDKLCDECVTFFAPTKMWQMLYKDHTYVTNEWDVADSVYRDFFNAHYKDVTNVTHWAKYVTNLQYVTNWQRCHKFTKVWQIGKYT